MITETSYISYIYYIYLSNGKRANETSWIVELLWKNPIRGENYSALGHVACNYTRRLHETRLHTYSRVYSRWSNAICARCLWRNVIVGRNEGPLWKLWAVTVDLIIIVSSAQHPSIQSNFHPLFSPLLWFTQCFYLFPYHFKMFSPKVFIFWTLHFV